MTKPKMEIGSCLRRVAMVMVVCLCLLLVDAKPSHKNDINRRYRRHWTASEEEHHYSVDMSVVLSRDCVQSLNSSEYRGHKSRTISGLECQRWDSQYPHEHDRNDIHEHPAAVYNEANYCRNPDLSDGIGPWCYTTDARVRWESCEIPLCPDCKSTSLGMEYRGRRSVTSSGRTCQRWDRQYPHEHERNDVTRFPNAVNNEANYCRNPDGEGNTPWCYTTDPDVRWQYCDIPLCDGCRNTVSGGDYRGTKSVTLSGRTCQRWDSQTPHRHDRNDVTEYPNAAYNEDNYCRDPDNDGSYGPWCYTTDPYVRWEPCGIPLCPDFFN